MLDWIVRTMAEMGYGGIVLLMFLENVFPPIPSELIMSLAGFTAARGEMNLWLAILAGVVGTILGALPWYYAGRLMGEERIAYLAGRFGRLMTVSPDEVHAATRWFGRYGRSAVFLGRMVPAVRTLISAPAGIACMPMLPFLAYSTIGTTLWVGMLAVVGYLLEGQYALVETYADPASKAVVLAIVAVYLYRVVTFKRRASRGA